MKKETAPIDYTFLGITAVLAICGLFAFFSAALGVLARNESTFYSIIMSQLLLGLVGGSIALYAGIRIPYTFWRKHATVILISSIVLTLLVFIPGLGVRINGARRWISIAGFSFQPVEFLKIGFILYMAAWFSWAKKRISSPLYAILPLGIVLAIIGGTLVFQPDTKSLILMSLTGLVMLFLSGAPMKHLLGLGVLAVVGFLFFAMRTPYLADRISTFMHPTNDPTGSSYQLQQSLIAIGSGELSGRGFGQSLQKFSYLPEPHGDSIFAVISEEFGFIGATILVLLYILFCMRGLWIARRAPDLFSGLFVSGLVILITLQSFMNIASITGLFPLTGVPLVFVSHGGTSLMVSLGAVGIILGISKYKKKQS